MAQGRMRLLQVLDLPRERVEFAAGRFAHARAFMCAIKADEFCDLAQGEARDFRAPYKAQPFKVSAVIKPVRAGASWRLFQQAFAVSTPTPAAFASFAMVKFAAGAVDSVPCYGG